MMEQDHMDAEAAKGSVLLAQNTRFLTAFFHRALIRMGVESISVATDGMRVLELLQSNSFDLLLLDLDMPGISGLEVLETLRSDQAYNSLPVVVTANRCDQDTVTKALELGASDFLSKPYSQNTVDARILRAIESTNAPADTPLTILTAHRDPKFQRGVAGAFGRSATLHIAQNVGMFLARTAAIHPNVVIIEPSLFGARLDFCMRSAARLRDPAPAVISVGEMLPADQPPNYLGSIPVDVRPATLEQSVQRLLEGGGRTLPEGMPNREAFTSIIQQAFGMLLGMDVTRVKDRQLPTDVQTVSVDLYIGNRVAWTIELQANVDTAITITTDMMSAARGSVDPDHSLRGLGEIGRVVARRVRQIAMESDIRLEVGQPRHAAAPSYRGDECIVFHAEDIAPFSAAIGPTRSAPELSAPDDQASEEGEDYPCFMLLVQGTGRSISAMSEPERCSFVERYSAWVEMLAQDGSMLAGGGVEHGSGGIVLRGDDATSVAQDTRLEVPQTTLGCWLIKVRDLDEAVSWALKNPFDADSVEIRKVSRRFAVGAGL